MYYDLLNRAVYATLMAGKEVMKVYERDFAVSFKDNKTPLTAADMNAHYCITEILEKTGIPLVSEEMNIPDYHIRKKWEYLWLIDPLDGTREFVKRNGEFTVNIALIRSGNPVAGVIFQPVTDSLYYASVMDGAYMLPKADSYISNGNLDSSLFRYGRSLPYSSVKRQTVVASRSHLNAATQSFINSIEGEKDLVNIGSSLKFCLLAEGKADMYPRFGPTMEWDTAAGDAILRASGGMTIHAENSEPLTYNKPDLKNPDFIAFRLSS